MKNRIYVVYDRVAEESGPIFEARNDGVALRKFNQVIAGDNVDINDFQLFCLGTIDHSLSLIDAHPPEVILIGFNNDKEEQVETNK